MRIAIAGVALLISSAALGQEPAFEVASVKVNKTGGGMMPFANIQANPGSLTMRGASFKAVVAWAYDVREFQVTGPDWIESARFDILAKAAGAAPAERMRLMLRTLLVERFDLAVHKERKEQAVWVLTVGKNGLTPAVKESADDGDLAIQPNPSKMEITVKRGSASQMVEILAKVLREPVVDETGLNGKYDLTVNISKYMPDGSSAPDIAALAVRAIQAEMGLTLEHRRTPMDYVVVDRAVKEPVEN